MAPEVCLGLRDWGHGVGGNVRKNKDSCPSGVAKCNVNPRAEMVIFLFLVTHKCTERQIEERAIQRKGRMGRDIEGGRKGEEEEQKVTDTKQTRDTREKARLRSGCEGSKGRKRKARHRWENRQGDLQRKSTNWEARRETRGEKIPNIKPALKFPHRVSQGEVATSSHPGPTTSTEAGTAKGQSSSAGGKAQD